MKRGNAENLPFGSGAFDCVTVSLALHEMAYDTRMGVAAEMLRIMPQGGKLIVFDYAAAENMRFALAPGFLGLLERIAGADHFNNFVRFIRTGGIDHFLKAFPLEVISSRNYFPGAMKLVIAQKRQSGIT